MYSKALQLCILLRRGALTLGMVLVLSSAMAHARETVRISGFTWPGYGFWHIVKAKNLAPDLEIAYTTIEDPYESFNLLTAGHMDVVSSTVEFTPIGVSRGMPLRLVAFANLSYGTDKIIVGPGVDGPKDLVGKDVAVVEGGLAQIYVAMWLERNGLKFNDVNYVNIIADDAFAAMVGGVLPASEFWEPYGSNVLKALEGSKIAAQSREPFWLENAVIADGLYMNSDFIEKRPEVARATLKALYDAIAWWKANPEEGNEIIAAGLGMSVADVELVIGKDGTGLDGGLYVYDFLEAARFCGSAPGQPPFGQKNGQIAAHWKLMNDWWRKFGHMKETLPPDRGIDCSLHEHLFSAGYRG